MSSGERMQFELRVGPVSEPEITVRRIHGIEEISGLFTFEVDFVPVSGLPMDLDLVVGAEACLSIRRPDGHERKVNGICATIAYTGVQAGRSAYRVMLAPKLALLERGRDCRIFQDKTAPEVVRSVLDEHGIHYRDESRGAFPVRDMCIQYRETDLAFVSRLLEEEGIAYWFEHGDQEHLLVLGDSPGAFTSLPGGEDLPFRPEIGAVSSEEHCSALRLIQEMKASQVMVRDFDFERPLLDVTGASTEGSGEEIYDYPAGTTDPSDARRISRLRLEALRAGMTRWTGEGSCERLAQGHVFRIVNHPDERLERRLLALRVEHEGSQQTGSGDAEEIDDRYWTRFQAVEVNRPFRPFRRTPRPVVSGVQTATVVGPPGEEIHTDRYGRVKVQFHWDREGRNDDRSSAWVRTAQSWSGAGFGALFIPRVGQEVLVRFLEGNPDRPLVAGAVYNGQNTPPITLPLEKTQSTLKTRSSLQSDGSNELRFEDASGFEQILLHAQRDENIEVLNDKDQIVHKNEYLRVEKDRSLTVNRCQALSVAINEASQIGSDQALSVRRNRQTAVAGGQTERVSGLDAVSVKKCRTERVQSDSSHSIGGDARLEIGRGYELNVGGSSNEVVAGGRTTRVGRNRTVDVGGHRDEAVGGNRDARAGGDSALDVTGQIVTYVERDLAEDVAGHTEVAVEGPAQWRTRRLMLEADQLSIVVGGRVALSMDRSGRIDVSGQVVIVNGDRIVLRGSKVQKVGASAMGQQEIQLGIARELRQAHALVEFTVIDQDGNPVVNQKSRLEFSDGTVRSGTTDGDGRTKLPAPDHGTYRLTFPADQRAEGRQEMTAAAANTRKGSGAQRVERGKTYGLSTDRNHLLQLPEQRSVMTMAFFLSTRPSDDYPRYVLESLDGAYRSEKSLRDLVQGSRSFQLRFENLLGGRGYRLTRWHAADRSEVVFDGLPYGEVVDQHRPLMAAFDKVGLAARVKRRPR